MAKIENIRHLWGFDHGLGEFVVKQGRRMLYGLINTAGEIVLHPQPKRLLILDERQVMLWRSERIKGDKDIVLDLETRESYSVERYDAENDGSAVIWKRGKGYGTVDVDGNTIIPPQYRRLYRIGGDHFVARNRKNKSEMYSATSCKEILGRNSPYIGLFSFFLFGRWHIRNTYSQTSLLSMMLLHRH